MPLCLARVTLVAPVSIRPNPGPEMIALPVLTLNGRRCHLMVEPTTTIHAVKEMIFDMLGVPVDLQRLCFATSRGDLILWTYTVGEQFTMEECQITADSCLRVWWDRGAANHPDPVGREVLLESQSRHRYLGRIVHPKELLHTHQPGAYFQDRRRVEETRSELVADQTLVLPWLKVYEFCGQLWCRSNRRLAAYRLAGREKLVEGTHWKMYSVDGHFIDGLDLPNLILIQTVIRLSSIRVDGIVMKALEAATIRETLRAEKKTAADR